MIAPGWRIHAILFCAGSMVCLPFLAPFKAPPIPTFHGEILAAALGLLALCLTVPWARNGALPLARIAVLPLLLALLLLVQVVSGQIVATQMALLAMLYLLWAAGMILVAACLKQAMGLELVTTALAWFLIIGGVLSSAAGTAQLLRIPWLAGWVMPTDGGVWGNLGQPNHFANYLSLTLASVLLLWSRQKLTTPLALILAAWMGLMLTLSGSRSVWLYATWFALVAAWWNWRVPSLPARRLMRATVMFIPLMLLAEGLWRVFGVEGLGTITGLERLQDQGVGERWRLLELGWRMISKSPWQGVGYGQYAWNYFLLNSQLTVPLNGYAHHAHNLVVQLWAELGLGAVLALALGAWLWVRAWRRLPATPETWWLLALTGVLAIHAMLEYPLWYVYFLGLGAVVLGLTETATIEFAPSVALRSLVLGCLALSWVVLAQLFRDYVYLENFLAFRYRYIDATAQVSERAKEMLLDIRRTSLLAPYVELGLARAIDVTPAQLEAKLQVNAHAMRQFPVDDVVYRQAMLLAMTGGVEAAMQQWRMAVVTYPELQPVALAVLRARAGEYGAGLRTLLASLEKPELESDRGSESKPERR